MERLKVMTIFGTRPEAIKMAPVVKKLRANKMIETIVTVTAQHREMLDQVLDLFEIEPDYDLDIMKANQNLSDITVNVLKGINNIYVKEKPDLVLVHGDTSTTFVGALASYYQQIKIAHVEAGLRTYDKYSPFPEEINRHLTGVLADIHFAPTQRAKKNLLQENISDEKIYVTGNTVVDALLETVDENYKFNHPLLSKFDFAQKKIILLTAHRRENLGKPMQNIFNAILKLLNKNKNIEVIFPVHLNPKVKMLAEQILGDVKGVHLIEPLEYESFANLMNKSDIVLTDSGGIQEEAPGLGKPVLVLRETTERPEAVTAGTVKKVGTDLDKIFETTDQLINDDQAYKKMANSVNPYGDGQASQRILQRILFEFGLGDKPGQEYF